MPSGQTMFSQAIPLVILDGLLALLVAGAVRRFVWRASLWLLTALLSAPVYYFVPGYFSNARDEYVLWAPLFLRPFLLFACLATAAGTVLGDLVVRFLKR